MLAVGTLFRGHCCGEVAVVERWPLCRRGGRCGEVRLYINSEAAHFKA